MAKQTATKGSPTIQPLTGEPTVVQDPDEYAIWSAILTKEFAHGSFRDLLLETEPRC